ncbi:adhesion G protein-coupled receptor E3-like isoform X2 [Scyliorhinus canicula]|uniref:adhesion G protein-coupled receptor E3-like isoform X2 n=1 Tax=Scyliorhinus canicula TaxID=7830 RepID=UPI0018F454FE|nr:adhesion G protein-coupled receptor E3-like isoform X2 [Scyliorhinus canicula]
MDQRRFYPGLIIYLGYLVVLSVGSTRLCPHEDTLMRDRGCLDINECDVNDDLCGPNGSCRFTEGSYVCSCDQGFVSSGETDSFDLTRIRCREIDSAVHTRIRERDAPDNGNTPLPVNGITPEPLHGNTPAPVHGITPPPVNGITPPAVDGLTHAPVNGMTPPPVNGITPAPVNGMTPPPVNGITPAPVNGITPPPVNGITPPPVNGITPPPVNGITPPPVNGITPEPLHGNTPAPVNGITPAPLNGITPAPVDGKTPPPVNRITPAPVNGITSEPLNGKTLPPVNGITPPPVNGITPPPVNGITPPPVNGITPPPVNGITPPPVNEITPLPVNEITPEPLHGNTPAPVDEITPAPVIGNTSAPVTGNTPGNGKKSASVNENTSASVIGNIPAPIIGNIPAPSIRNTPAPVHGPTPTPPAEARDYSISAVGTTGIEASLSTEPAPPAAPVEFLCSLMTNANWLLDELCQKPTNGSTAENAVLPRTKLLTDESLLKEMGQEARLTSASQILQGVERAATKAALNSAGQEPKSIRSKAMALQLQVINVTSISTDDKVRLEVKGNTMEISWTAATSSKMTGSVAIAFIVYENMEAILRGAHYENQETSQKYEDVQLWSRVISAALGSSGNYKPPLAVSFILKHKQGPTAVGKLLCAYWSHTRKGSHWSSRGCELLDSNDTHTTCQCDHLSSFAILMAFTEELQDYSHDALSVIMFIGIPISLACLAVAIGTFVLCWQARNAVTATHTQLCASLFLAELVFITGINRTENRTVCGIIAGCLHYLFLTAFAWMSLESIQLHLMVRNLKNMRVSHSSNIEKYIYLLGYGLPALIVAISATVYPNGYGSQTNCWLRVENGFVWSFLGPVYLIILVNTFLFTMTLYTLNEELSNRDVKVSKIKDTRMLTFKAIGQVFILGCTWILGLFHFQEETVAMAYLFTIVNSFQGTFIFIILCVLNPKIRAEWRKWITSISRTRRSLFESESTKVPLSVTSETV